MTGMTEPLLAHRITHRHIEVFRAVMTAGSATGAADLLHSSQPTVSRELARLESLLGYALFERVQGRLRPNARALALWDEVQRSWQGLERVVERAVALGRPDAVQLSVLCLPALAHALLPGAAARLLQARPLIAAGAPARDSTVRSWGPTSNTTALASPVSSTSWRGDSCLQYRSEADAGADSASAVSRGEAIRTVRILSLRE